MEFIYTVIEAVVIAFFMGAILGGVVVAHFRNKSVVQTDEDLQLERVKVKIDRD